MSCSLVDQHLLQNFCPPCVVATAFVFEDGEQLHQTKATTDKVSQIKVDEGIHIGVDEPTEHGAGVDDAKRIEHSPRVAASELGIIGFGAWVLGFHSFAQPIGGDTIDHNGEDADAGKRYGGL